MSYKYTFDPIALLEYHTAIIYYGDHSTVAADSFINEFEEKI